MSSGELAAVAGPRAMSSGELAAVAVLEPVSSPPTWKPVQVFDTCIALSGGLSSKGPSIANSIIYMQDGQSRTFVELSKNASWFLKGVAGPSSQKGDLKTVTVVNDIRETLRRSWMEPEDDETAVAADPGHDKDEDIDPMDALDAVVEKVPRLRAKAKAKPKQGPPRAQVYQVSMPKRPACAGKDQQETIHIWVYRKPGPPRTATLYLRTDCLDWLLSYGADQHHFQGVERADPAPSEQDAANCSAVAGLRLTWDFAGKAWDAEFVTGAFQGMKRSVALADITRDLWDTLKSRSAVDGDWVNSSLPQRKAVAKSLITKWCDAITQGGEEAFKREWGVGDVAFETPKKKRRHQQDDAIKPE